MLVPNTKSPLRICLLTLLAVAGVTLAQDPAVAVSNDPVQLPQKHEYQKIIRNYLATLTEADFDHQVTEKFTLVEPLAPELRYRLWLLQKDVPKVGFKRGAPSLTMPPNQFLLSTLEAPGGVRLPAVWSQPLAWLCDWQYAVF